MLGEAKSDFLTIVRTFSERKRSLTAIIFNKFRAPTDTFILLL